MDDAKWTTGEIADKVDSEGGWWEFYMWGGLKQRTGDLDVDSALDELQVRFFEAERLITQLQEHLPEPGSGEE